MAKLTTITIDNKLYDIGEIKRVSNLPSTITIDSPEIIIYNNELYIKHFTNGAYSYKNFAPPLTAGENISISDDGVISVTGELGTQIEANPELSGDETKLSSISIDGVNYDIPEGAKAYVEDEEMLVIDEGDIQGIETGYVDQEIAELKEYVDQEVIALQEYINSKISVTVNDDDTIDVTIN